MQRHQLGSIMEDEFTLIAIHSNIEDYKLAFLINKHLNIQLKRKENDLDFFKKEGHITFSVFEFENSNSEDVLYLISNTCKTITEKITSAGSLFESSSEEIVHYLIPEFKKTEFILKIIADESEKYQKNLITQLNNIPYIITAYKIDLVNLKSINNLNFD